MRKFLVTAIALMGLSPVAVSSPAQATPGCIGSQIDKVDAWSEVVGYSYYTWPARLPQFAKLRVTASTIYAYCPNGTWSSLVRVKGASYCYSWSEGYSPNGYFDGVKFNPFYFDDNEEVNPGEVKVNDDGSWQNCVDYWIPTENRRWFEMEHSPGWTMSGWVVVKYNPDTDIDWRIDGSSVKYFHPSTDPNVSGWYS